MTVIKLHAYKIQTSLLILSFENTGYDALFQTTYMCLQYTKELAHNKQQNTYILFFWLSFHKLKKKIIEVFE